MDAAEKYGPTIQPLPSTLEARQSRVILRPVELRQGADDHVPAMPVVAADVEHADMAAAVEVAGVIVEGRVATSTQMSHGEVVS